MIYILGVDANKYKKTDLLAYAAFTLAIEM